MTKTKSRWSLRRRLVSGLVAYLVMLTLGVLVNDRYVNERAEALVWESLLTAELDHFLSRRQADPQYHLGPMESLELFELKPNDKSIPELSSLTPGLHDEIVIGGRERVLLVRDTADARVVIALDITDLEGREAQIRSTVFVSAFVSALFLVLLAALGMTRLTNPLTELAATIRLLNPENKKQKIIMPENASYEIAVIVEAMNGYGGRIEDFIEREREFISMTSHELRTPLTIIDGAIDLALQEPSLSVTAKNRLLRVRETVTDVKEMIVLLLVLSKNPERLSETNDNIALDRMLVETIKDLQPLAQGKGLDIIVGSIADCVIVGPPAMVKSAIANLIRNAIEHTHAGQITVDLHSPATIHIVNPVHQTSAEEIARSYTRLARSGRRDGGGVGLALISRLCTHCGWDLSIQNEANSSISMKLNLRKP